MTTFQQIALLLPLIWSASIVIRFRHSTVALVIGLVMIGLYTVISLVFGFVTLSGLGFRTMGLPEVGLSLAGLAIILVYSPLADRLASRWFRRPPTLDSFRPIQRSKVNLVIGILAAWLLGGFLEELIARGIVLQAVETFLEAFLPSTIATVPAIFIAAAGAGLLHSYQGPRAVVIIMELSILLGLLFVLSGYNLWTVILCHGLYDTIAFIRFATKTSRYSNLE